MKNKCYMVICDLNIKYENDIKNIGEIQRHYDNNIDVSINIGKTVIKIDRDTFNIVTDIGYKLLCIPPCDYGNIYIH